MLKVKPTTTTRLVTIRCPICHHRQGACTVAPDLRVLLPRCTNVTAVITGELKSKIDQTWNAFWSGGISNPLEVIEQITYLLFLRRLDDLQTTAESKARILGDPIEDPKFLPGQAHLRWSRFKNLDADVMFKTVATQVFPFLQKYATRSAVTTRPTPST